MKIIKVILILFFITSCGSSKMTAQNPSSSSPEERDEQNWSSAVKEDTIDSYNRYYFNTTKYRELAFRKIEKKKWDLAKAINIAQSYEQYLIQYPSGAHSETARDLLSIVPGNSNSLDQKYQKAKKINNYEYLIALINFFKSYPGGNIDSDILLEIWNILEDNFPSKLYQKSHHYLTFKKELSTALKRNKPFLIGFKLINVKNITKEPIVQELGGQEATINNVEIKWEGANCKDNRWSYSKWSPIKIEAYGNMEIKYSYSIPCSLNKLWLLISTTNNTLSL